MFRRSKNMKKKKKVKKILSPVMHQAGQVVLPIHTDLSRDFLGVFTLFDLSVDSA